MRGSTGKPKIFNEKFSEYNIVAAGSLLGVAMSRGGTFPVGKVDFVFQYNNDLIPVEVKSGENVRGRSLFVYSEKYHPPIRISFSMKNLTCHNGLLNIPLFLADYTFKFI